MKRFYKDVSVDKHEDCFAVLLDGRPIMSPCQNMLEVASLNLAEAIATEWKGQGEDIDVMSMPLTRIANTIIDKTDDYRDEIIENLIKYADTDLLCYLAEEPQDLIDIQQNKWLPILKWLSKNIGVTLNTTSGVMPISQPQEQIDTLRDYISCLSSDKLVITYLLTQAIGSIVLSIAVIEGKIKADDAFERAHLDENYQEEYWGKDKEEMKRRTRIKEEIADLEYFLKLIK